MKRNKKLTLQRVEKALEKTTLKKKVKKLEFVIYGHTYEVKIKNTKVPR